MRSENLIIIFTMFDDKVKNYLSAFDVQHYDNINLLGIGYQCYECDEHLEGTKNAYPILLVRDNNYSCDFYAPEIKHQIELHERFLLVLHRSSRYKSLQRDSIIKGNFPKLVHPIMEEHHDSGSAFDLMNELAGIQEETQFYANIETYFTQIMFNKNKEIKLFILNSINSPEDAQRILDGKLQDYPLASAMDKLLQNQEIKEKIVVFAEAQIGIQEFKFELIEVLKMYPN